MTTILQTRMLKRSELEPRRTVSIGDDRALSPVLSAVENAAPQRFMIGRIEVRRVRYFRQDRISIAPTETRIHVVIPLAGSAMVVAGGESFALVPGEALLLGSMEHVVCEWSAGAQALLLHMPRASIQAAASREFGTARRLAALDCLFEIASDAIGDQCMAGLGEAPILEALVGALRANAQASAIFPVARSVQRVVDAIRSDPLIAWSVDDLAAVAGITAGTLRRNFRTCLGLSVTQLVQQLRLEWVRSRLESVTESRSIAELSVASGFGASGMLNRTYQRHFGETPSQTRTRVFRSQRG